MWVTIFIAVAVWLAVFLTAVNLRVRRGRQRTRGSDQFAGTVAGLAVLVVFLFTQVRWDVLLIGLVVCAPGLLFLAGEQAFRGFPRVEGRRLLTRRSRP